MSGALGLCSCGTVAIGICQQCSAPVCGLCSYLDAGRRVCNQHYWDAQAAEAARQAERQAQLARDRKEARSAPELDAIEHEPLRAVQAIAWACAVVREGAWSEYDAVARVVGLAPHLISGHEGRLARLQVAARPIAEAAAPLIDWGFPPNINISRSTRPNGRMVICATYSAHSGEGFSSSSTSTSTGLLQNGTWVRHLSRRQPGRRLQVWADDITLLEQISAREICHLAWRLDPRGWGVSVPHRESSFT